MDGKTLSCGGVAAVENVRKVAALARLVMEKTPHLLLAGDGALWFALKNGFPLETLHTPESVKEWYDKHPDNKKKGPGAGGKGPVESAEALGVQDYDVPIDENNHDTVTVLARDAAGHLGGRVGRFIHLPRVRM